MKCRLCDRAVSYYYDAFTRMLCIWHYISERQDDDYQDSEY